MQVSGLDFKFQIAAPKHFSHNNWKKAAATDLDGYFFPQPFAAVPGTAVSWQVLNTIAEVC